MPLNKQQLEVVNQTNFPDNNTQLITPELLREFNTDIIDAIQLTGSYATTGSNSFVGNQTITGNLNVSGVISASVLYVQTETSSVIYSSGSNQFGDELSDIQTLSGSVKVQGSLTVNGTPVLTSSADVTGFVTTSSFNAYTASNNQRVSSLETNSASVNISITNVNSATASLFTSVNSLNSFTQSQSQLNGTFATTGSNTFTGNQIIDRASKLFTNGIYWTDPTAGFNNLEIINQIAGNIDLAALNGGVRIVSSSLNITNGTFTASLAEGFTYVGNGSNRTALVATSSFGTPIPSGTVSSSAQILNYNIFATTGSNAFFGTNSFSGAVSFTGSAPSILSSSFSGSLITNLTDVYTDVEAVQQIVTLSSASYAALVSGSLTNPNTLYLISGSIGSSVPAGTISSSAQITSLGFVSSSVTASSLITASFSGNTLTFTKGDSTTFGVVIPDVSGSTINTGSFVTTSSFNAYTQSNDQRVTSLEANSASVNTSITNINSATSSLFTSASLGLTTASFAGNTLTFTKGNGTTFGVVIPDVSGSTIPAGTVSSSAQIVNYGIFATTGSNQFIGNQAIDGTLTITGKIIGSQSLFLQPNANDFRYLEIYNTSPADTHITASGGELFLGNDETYVLVNTNANQKLVVIRGDEKIVASGSLDISGSLSASLEQGYVWVGNASGRTVTVATSSFGGGGSVPAGTISGSQQITNLGFVSSSVTASSLVTASFSGNTLTFTKGDSSTFGVVIPDVSGSTINTGSFATTGSNVFIGDETFQDGSGNASTLSPYSGSIIFVSKGSTSGSAGLSNITASASTFVNLIFKSSNTQSGSLIISGSGNIFTNQTEPTAGFRKYISNSNIGLATTALPQLSSSMAFSPTVTSNYFGTATQAAITVRGPVSSSAWTIQNNVIVGGGINLGTAAATNYERAINGTTMQNNLINGTLNVTAYKTAFTFGAMGINSSNLGGTIGVNADSSSITIANASIQNGGLTINNSYYNASASSGNGNSLTIGAGNAIFGNSILIYASGSNTTGTVGRQYNSNVLAGTFNTASMHLNGDNSNIVATVIIGHNLVVTGSAALQPAAVSRNNTYGSAFFGRHNAQDGNKAGTGETVFAIGTGTTTTPKTGFLIDSGSNTFIEGTLNVSGSSSFTGSVKVASTFQLQLPTGSNQQAGTAVLDGGNPGTVTVSNSLVTANTIIMVSKQTLAHPNGYVAVSAKSAGSFTITSNHNGDTDTVGWFIINNS